MKCEWCGSELYHSKCSQCGAENDVRFGFGGEIRGPRGIQGIQGLQGSPQPIGPPNQVISGFGKSTILTSIIFGVVIMVFLIVGIFATFPGN